MLFFSLAANTVGELVEHNVASRAEHVEVEAVDLNIKPDHV